MNHPEARSPDMLMPYEDHTKVKIFKSIKMNKYFIVDVLTDKYLTASSSDLEHCLKYCTLHKLIIVNYTEVNW